MLVFADYNVSSRFCIVSSQRSISAERVSVCLQSRKPTFNLTDASHRQPPRSAAANLSIYTIYKEQTSLPPEQIINTSTLWIQ